MEASLSVQAGNVRMQLDVLAKTTPQSALHSMCMVPDPGMLEQEAYEREIVISRNRLKVRILMLMVLKSSGHRSSVRTNKLHNNCCS